MKQYSLDSNSVLRYILEDISSQADVTQKYLAKARAQEITLFISCLVFVEAVFTLKTFYKKTKEEIAERLFQFARIPYIQVEKREIVTEALLLYPKTSVSFIDILLLIETAQKGMELMTFDKKLAKLATRIKKEYTAN